MARLLDFWHRAQSEPFQYGKTDCALWVASYIEAKTGKHPAPDMVGAYNTKFGARRSIIAAGGFLGLASRYMAGFPSGDEVGVFRMDNNTLCGIKRGNMVAFKGEDGLMITGDAMLIKGWNI